MTSQISFFANRFDDKDTEDHYHNEAKGYFSKMTPVAAAFVACLSIAIEVLQRLNYLESPVLSNTTSAVNWATVAVLIALSVLVRKYYRVCMLVSPLLTGFLFYYFCVVDF